ncbi:HGL029Wp [Eremothecium sinecaudum]|uniref:HGL029Wp n=1 Tax=Eremothecium sinecaudum TaxID=45286 RepID=A0A0X8HVK2_9SACH|nr:HGL029Wp [Eremothecium sinecaudum]AMD22311.1 HGL029Wp [Eremothecium sinecaudum]
MSALTSIPQNTKDRIRQFRFSTSRADTIKAIILCIQRSPSYEVIIDEECTEEAEEVNNIEDLRDVLPANEPRYVLLAYPTSTVDLRKRTLLVLLYWKPVTVVSQEWKMVYAGALEHVRSECAPNKYVEVTSSLEDDNDVDELKGQLEIK